MNESNEFSVCGILLILDKMQHETSIFFCIVPDNTYNSVRIFHAQHLFIRKKALCVKWMEQKRHRWQPYRFDPLGSSRGNRINSVMRWALAGHNFKWCGLFPTTMTLSKSVCKIMYWQDNKKLFNHKKSLFPQTEYVTL